MREGRMHIKRNIEGGAGGHLGHEQRTRSENIYHTRRYKFSIEGLLINVYTLKVIDHLPTCRRREARQPS